MNSIHKHVLVAAALTIATQAFAEEITFFGREGFEGGHVTANTTVDDLTRSGFSGRASSAVVVGQWEVCNGPGFTGRCVILLPGEYPSLRDVGVSEGIASARIVTGPPPIGDSRNPLPRGPHIAFYAEPAYRGPSFVSDRPILNMERMGFNKRASSIVVLDEQWEVCDGERFTGRCVILPPGRYPSFGVIGLNDAIASVRPVR